ncbi:mitogen-activated protein kinase kinase [Acrasis kona]|uniref:mitogen-activated protein kinase kinase n=1 Tax=Acrasis kona TaxID=1008807 RepID=A0AAW2ZK83_9EUKA
MNTPTEVRTTHIFTPRRTPTKSSSTKKPSKSSMYRPQLKLPTQEETPTYQSASGRFILDQDHRIGQAGIESITVNVADIKALSPNEPQVSKKIRFEELEILETLGEGASASVKKCVHKTTGTSYALKEIAMGSDSETKPKVIIAEFKALRDANKCPYVIELFDAFLRQGSLFILLEYMDRGSLNKILSKFGAMPEDITSCIAQQLLVALNFLHNKGVVHRDIKPENVLLNSAGVCKLADFGMAGIIDSKSKVFKTFQGTALYMSPERLKGQEHGFDSDIWSLGLTVAELSVGHLPNIQNFWDLMSQGGNDRKDDCMQDVIIMCGSPEMKDFVGKCVKINPKERSKAHELLNHPFITKHSDPQPCVKKWLDEKFKSPRRSRQKTNGPVVYVTGGINIEDLYD